MSRRSQFLLVEADPSSRDALAYALGCEGEVVHATPSALDALERARELTPNLAVMSWRTQDMEPVDLCKALSNKGLQVLFLADGPSRRQEALQAGALESLPVPAFLRDIVTAVKLMLRREREPSGEWVVRGRVSDFGLYPLIRAFWGLERSALIRLERGERTGEIRICDGAVMSVETRSVSGLAALFQLLLWPEAVLEIRFMPVMNQPRLGESPAELLHEAERFLRDFAHASRPMGSLGQVFEQDPLRIEEALSLIPSEVSGLVRLFDGKRTLIEIIEESPFRPFDSVRVVARLAAAGALRPQPRVPAPRGRKQKAQAAARQRAKAHARDKARIPVPVAAAEMLVLSKPPIGAALSGPVAPPAERIDLAESSLESRIEAALDRMQTNPFGLPPRIPADPRPEVGDTMIWAQRPPSPAEPLAPVAPYEAAAPSTQVLTEEPTTTTFTPLEEDFFAKVDEHGHLPGTDGPDTFDDLEPALTRHRRG